MGSHPLSLFALQASHDLGQRIAQALGVPLAAHEERDFEDGEHKARPLQSVRGHDVFVIHSLYGDTEQSGSDKLCRMLFFCGALKDAGAARVTAVVPYLCYARKDRRTKPNDPITSRYVGAMFDAVSVDQIITLEVHNIAAFENAFRCPSIHIDSASLFAAHFANIFRGAPVVSVSPDAGGAKRAESFRQELERMTGRTIGNAYMEKFRSAGVVSGGKLVGDVVGKTVVIIDDLISTGGTLVRSAIACKAAGATRIFAAAAHGLFVGGGADLLLCPALERIVITDTVPPFRVAAATAESRLVVLPSASSFANAIAASHSHE